MDTIYRDDHVTVTRRGSVFPASARQRIGDRMGDRWREQILERTARGEFDASAPGHRDHYSEEYARRKGVAIRPVTLRDSGAMLSKMTTHTDHSPDHVRVGISFSTADARQRARYHQREGSGRSRVVRRFMYVSRQGLDQLVRYGVAGGPDLT